MKYLLNKKCFHVAAAGVAVWASVAGSAQAWDRGHGGYHYCTYRDHRGREHSAASNTLQQACRQAKAMCQAVSKSCRLSDAS